MATATPGWASTTPTTIRPIPASAMAVAPSAPNGFGVLVLWRPPLLRLKTDSATQPTGHLDEKL